MENDSLAIGSSEKCIWLENIKYILHLKYLHCKHVPWHTVTAAAASVVSFNNLKKKLDINTKHLSIVLHPSSIERSTVLVSLVSQACVSVISRSINIFSCGAIIHRTRNKQIQLMHQ